MYLSPSAPDLSFSPQISQSTKHPSYGHLYGWLRIVTCLTYKKQPQCTDFPQAKVRVFAKVKAIDYAWNSLRLVSYKLLVLSAFFSFTSLIWKKTMKKAVWIGWCLTRTEKGIFFSLVLIDILLSMRFPWSLEVSALIFYICVGGGG